MADDEGLPELTEREFRDLSERTEFLDLVATGIPEINAALQVRWSPKKLKQMLADPEFVELVNAARDTFDGLVETTLGQMAIRGNMRAVEMWLYNRQKGRWTDVKKIEIDHTVTHNYAIVGVAVEAAQALLAQHGAGALQAFHQHAIEATGTDADE